METSFATARLHPVLVPYVRALHGASVRGGAPERQLELPVAGTAVIVALEHPWRIGVDATAPLRPFGSFAGGLSLAPAVSAHNGAYERLAERLAATTSWAERLALTQRWLAALIARAEAAAPPDLAWALDRIDAAGGRVTMATLQNKLGCSRRHLARRFARDVGATPKAYAQLVRFTRAAERLRGGQAPAAVAAACGYTDQAHLTRHVRRFGATTPAALRRGRPTPVPFVQDDPRPTA